MGVFCLLLALKTNNRQFYNFVATSGMVSYFATSDKKVVQLATFRFQWDNLVNCGGTVRCVTIYFATSDNTTVELVTFSVPWGDLVNYRLIEANRGIICVSDLGHLWFMTWPVACVA